MLSNEVNDILGFRIDHALAIQTRSTNICDQQTIQLTALDNFPGQNKDLMITDDLEAFIGATDDTITLKSGAHGRIRERSDKFIVLCLEDHSEYTILPNEYGKIDGLAQSTFEGRFENIAELSMEWERDARRLRLQYPGSIAGYSHHTGPESWTLAMLQAIPGVSETTDQIMLEYRAYGDMFTKPIFDQRFYRPDGNGIWLCISDNNSRLPERLRITLVPKRLPPLQPTITADGAYNCINFLCELGDALSKLSN